MKVLREYLATIQAKELGVGLGVAGGLCAERLYLLDGLLDEFPNLSIDAEGRLRDANDQLDLSAAKDYVLGAIGRRLHQKVVRRP